MADHKILYAVQGTGNGHISRARKLYPEFQRAGADVTALFSGRSKSELKDMESFGDYKTATGVTFATKDGKISYRKTARELHGRTFVREMRALDLGPYDSIVVDYEPVTAYAAKLRDRETIGVGNQYAYHYDIPKVGAHTPAMSTMLHFAPVTTPLGVHWDSFDQPILPPITDPPEPGIIEPDKVLVYMGFENVQDIIDLVKPFVGERFFIYSPQVKEAKDEGNIFLRPLSRDGFRHDLATCARVFCNAGFELPTEVLSLGKPLMVKPLERQIEQEANALALQKLGYGDAMTHFNQAAFGAWLEKDRTVKIEFPNTAKAIADWVVNTDRSDTQPLVDGLWKETKVGHILIPR